VTAEGSRNRRARARPHPIGLKQLRVSGRRRRRRRGTRFRRARPGRRGATSRAPGPRCWPPPGRLSVWARREAPRRRGDGRDPRCSTLRSGHGSGRRAARASPRSRVGVRALGFEGGCGAISGHAEEQRGSDVRRFTGRSVLRGRLLGRTVDYRGGWGRETAGAAAQPAKGGLTLLVVRYTWARNAGMCESAHCCLQ
jgi:hypothetical protein